MTHHCGFQARHLVRRSTIGSEQAAQVREQGLATAAVSSGSRGPKRLCTTSVALELVAPSKTSNLAVLRRGVKTACYIDKDLMSCLTRDNDATSSTEW